MKFPEIAISHLSAIPEEVFEEFLSAVRSDNLDLLIEAREEEGPYAGLEWLLPTAVIVYIGKSYFDAFLKEMGKDHYLLLKRGLSGFRQRFFGPSSPKVEIIATKGKAIKGQPYSHVFSIIAEANSGTRFKLLIQRDVSQDEYEEIIGSFLTFIEAYHSGSLNAEMINELKNTRVVGGTQLIAYDREVKILKPIDPIPDESDSEA